MGKSNPAKWVGQTTVEAPEQLEQARWIPQRAV
jgi:hypothetical protein